MSIALGGCGSFPKDADRSLERARSGETLHVGWTPAEPWVTPGDGGEPAGIEPDLIRAWAASHHIRIDWVLGSETELVQALQENAIDLALAGFTDAQPWGAKIGLTQPYLETEIVVGVSPNTEQPASWIDVPIRYPRGRPHFAALIRRLGAKPEPAQPGQLAPIGAAYREELSSLGLIPTKTLASAARVIATAPGESALTFDIDRFLYQRRRAISAALSAEARR
jgi:ABC-type amino acid transport substrate-binding protein